MVEDDIIKKSRLIIKNKNMQETDILIIGSGPAGLVAALTARKFYPNKKIVSIRENEELIIPCAIPYIFNRLDDVEDDLINKKILTSHNILTTIGRVEKIDKENKQAVLTDGNGIKYDKLVLALGSKPVAVPIEGTNKKGVFFVKKDFSYLRELKKEVLKAKKIIIIGGGFIGVEVAEEISGIEPKKEVTIIERSDHCLGKIFDSEFLKLAEEKLKEKGIKLINSRLVKRIFGPESVKGVVLDDETEVEADLVIVAIGAKPNIDLAKEAGLKIGQREEIWVDEYLRTSEKDIFAVGDCAETKDFFTRDYVPAMLASTACMEARVAGANLYELKILRENKGTLATFSTFIKDSFFAVSGLTEQMAKEQGFEIVTGEAEGFNRHPAKFEDTGKFKIKLIFAKSSGVLIGGEMMGPKSQSEIINLIALAIQKQVDMFELSFLQIATHPLLSSPPTAYPVIAASQNAIGKLKT